MLSKQINQNNINEKKEENFLKSLFSSQTKETEMVNFFLKMFKQKFSSEKKEEISLSNFDTIFQHIFVCFFNKQKNSLFEEKYKSEKKGTFFSKELMEVFETIFSRQLKRNEKIKKITRKKIIENGLEEIFINSSAFLMNSEPGTDYHKMLGIIINGRNGIGKNSLLESFCGTYGFKIEKIDFAMFKNLSEIRKKYNLAVNNVAIDIIKHNNPPTDNFYSKSKKRTKKISKKKTSNKKSINQKQKNNFLITVDDIINYNDEKDSDNEQSVCNYDRFFPQKKIFVCYNIDFLFLNSGFKKNEKCFLDFVEFIGKSNYPFVFLHDEKFNEIFGKNLKFFDVLEIQKRDETEMQIFIYLILVFETNFLIFENGDQINNSKNIFDSLNHSSNIDLKFPSLQRISNFIKENDFDFHKILNFLNINLDYFFLSER